MVAAKKHVPIVKKRTFPPIENFLAPRPRPIDDYIEDNGMRLYARTVVLLSIAFPPRDFSSNHG